MVREVSEKEAWSLVSWGVGDMLGLEQKEPRWKEGQFVVWEGSPLEIGGRVRAVGAGRGSVDVWEEVVE